MSFPKYPKYKASGVEWLGDVPEGWEVVPLFGVAVERKESNFGMVVSNLLSLSYGRIVRKDITSNDGLLPESFETYQIVRPGDIVLRLTDLQNDKRSLRSALVEETGIITSAYVAIAPRTLAPRFLSYLLRAYDATKVFYSMGGGLRQAMKFADVKRLPTLLPSQAEQLAIAAFLDRETAKIDELVNAQARLIELLKEKRQAVISNAVTKGLNPHAPMKPSGVEWLGDVPERWEVKRLKVIAPLVTDKAECRDNQIALENIEGWTGRYLPSETEFEGDGTAFLAGDILFGKLRPYLAKVLHVASSGQAIGDFHVLRPVAGVAGRFIQSQMLTREFIEIVDGSTFGSKMPRASWEFVGGMQMTLPPLPEQLAIAAFLDRETARIDTLTAEAQRAIDLLRERRSALISAAVTGQIDIRNTIPMEAA